MTTRHIATSIIALLLFTTAAAAQARNEQAGRTEFTAQDRQTTTDWYNKNKAHPPVGFRTQDRLTADQESRLKVGSKLDPDMQKLVHTLPPSLKNQFVAPAAGYRYVAVGGHVALLDKQNQVHDVIHVHE